MPPGDRQRPSAAAWLALGFRPFFTVAALHAALVVALWAGILDGWVRPPLGGLPPAAWHAHEMVYGFARAVVAGFLLTAVRNWTGQPTPTGGPLAALVVLWGVPRVVTTVGGPALLPLAGALDVAFGVALAIAVARPVVAARQGRQAGIVAKVALLAVGELLFHLGAAGVVPHGVRWGLGTGLYLVLALVLTIARRVVPFFVRAAVPGTVVPDEPPALERLSLVAFVLLYVFDVFVAWPAGVSATAGLLAALQARRGMRWWVADVARRSMLWVLFAAHAWIVIGFALQALAPWVGLAPALALHAHAAGGIGMMAIGMMARVSLGHTGRDVRAHRPGLAVLFLLVAAAAGVRVFVPWLAPAHTASALRGAAVGWTLAFGLLAAWGLGLWTRPRPDGAPG